MLRKAKASFAGEVGGEGGGDQDDDDEEEDDDDDDKASDSDDACEGSAHRRQLLHLPPPQPPPSSSASLPNRGAAAAPAAQTNAAQSSPLALPPPPPPPSSSALALAAAALAAAASDVREGLRFAAARRHVLALVTIKLCGTLVWGAADIMNVKLSDSPSLALRKKSGALDSSATLGIIFACVGVGAMVGSVLSNALTSPDARSLLRSASAAFGLLTLGYVLLSAAAAASSLAGVLFATAARAAGSAVLWTYSTLLLQVEVPDALLGRICALEQALYTVGECFSAVAAGVLFDAASAAKAKVVSTTTKAKAAASKDASVEAAAALMALVAGAFWAFWASYVRVHERKRAK